MYEVPYLLHSTTFGRGARVLAVSSGHATVAWQSEVMSNDVFSCVIMNGYVYGFDIQEDQSDFGGKTKGEFKCIELSTGKEMWASSRTGQATPIVCGNHLVLVNEVGELIIVEATHRRYIETYRETLSFDDQLFWSPPALADGYLIVRGSKKTACFFLGDPEESPFRLGLTARIVNVSRQLGHRWIGQYRDASFSEPSVIDLLKWYASACVAVVIASLGARFWKDGRGMIAYSLMATVLGLIMTPALTALMQEFVFTIPTTLFSLFCLVTTIWVGVDASATKSVWLARVSLVAFTALCIAIVSVCQALEVHVSYGFLVGFPFAWPLTIKLSERAKNVRWGITTLALALSAFTVYYWTSALFILWKT